MKGAILIDFLNNYEEYSHLPKHMFKAFIQIQNIDQCSLFGGRMALI